MAKSWALKIIAVLERAKHDHYTEPEGLGGCEGWNYIKDAQGHGWHYELTGPCTCGASEINAEIDAMIQEICEESGCG